MTTVCQLRGNIAASVAEDEGGLKRCAPRPPGGGKLGAMRDVLRLLVGLLIAVIAMSALALVMGGVVLLFYWPIQQLIDSPVGEHAFGVVALIIVAVVFLGLLVGGFVVAFTMAAGIEAYSRLRNGDQGWPGYRAILAGAWGRLWR